MGESLDLAGRLVASIPPMIGSDVPRFACWAWTHDVIGPFDIAHGNAHIDLPGGGHDRSCAERLTIAPEESVEVIDRPIVEQPCCRPSIEPPSGRVLPECEVTSLSSASVGFALIGVHCLDDG